MENKEIEEEFYKKWYSRYFKNEQNINELEKVVKFFLDKIAIARNNDCRVLANRIKKEFMKIGFKKHQQSISLGEFFQLEENIDDIILPYLEYKKRG